ncbi:hypothetical protein [Streptomyces olivaceus]|uniref:hypothetical protein n=1 Tax=Streptomyces olivaceus TaxID=47716 RepID=UPI003647989D
MLLVLGGFLLTIAVIAFSLVSWGYMGITGRALVLGGLTVGALGAPLVLLRRGRLDCWSSPRWSRCSRAGSFRNRMSPCARH